MARSRNSRRRSRNTNQRWRVYWHTSSHGVEDYYLPTAVNNTFETSLQFKYEVPVMDAYRGRRLDIDAYYDVVRSIRDNAGQKQVHIVMLGV